jgi:hypothetical protein
MEQRRGASDIAIRGGHVHHEKTHSETNVSARWLAFPRRSVTTGNLLLSLLDFYRVHQSSQGDSTGRLAGL